MLIADDLCMGSTIMPRDNGRTDQNKPYSKHERSESAPILHLNWKKGPLGHSSMPSRPFSHSPENNLTTIPCLLTFVFIFTSISFAITTFFLPKFESIPSQFHVEKERIHIFRSESDPDSGQHLSWSEKHVQRRKTWLEKRYERLYGKGEIYDLHNLPYINESAVDGKYRMEHTRSLGDNTIFVSIAAYRDVLCNHTLEDLFSKCDECHRIRVGLLDQYDPEKNDKPCVVPPRFRHQTRLVRVPAQSAKYAFDGVLGKSFFTKLMCDFVFSGARRSLVMFVRSCGEGKAKSGSLMFEG